MCCLGPTKPPDQRAMTGWGTHPVRMTEQLSLIHIKACCELMMALGAGLLYINLD
jgi:hypothetical protein